MMQYQAWCLRLTLCGVVLALLAVSSHAAQAQRGPLTLAEVTRFFEAGVPLVDVSRVL